uniref:Uncharacterized protein n=1 Tax=Ananas comosus var. bracteatus TaxID=296719 RepID=A0A6V7P1X7_ANACO|nr:unnamed protein product [Ananas comosus var. bracteatus]
MTLLLISAFVVHKNVAVFPFSGCGNREWLFGFLPRLAIVDEHLTKQLPKQWLTSLAIDGTMGNDRKDDILTIGSRLFLDLSDHLELSSLPGSNGVLKYLAGKTMPLMQQFCVVS